MAPIPAKTALSVLCPFPPTPSGAISRPETCSRHNSAPSPLWASLALSQLAWDLGFGSLELSWAWGRRAQGLCHLSFYRCPGLCCPLLPTCTQERRARCTQHRASPANPPTSHHQAQALRRDPNSGKISKSTPCPVLLLDIGETHIYIALLLMALKSVFGAKTLKKMYYV